MTDYRINSGKQDEKDVCNEKKDILRPVQQDAELKDKGPKKKDSPVENRTSGNPCHRLTSRFLPGFSVLTPPFPINDLTTRH